MKRPLHKLQPASGAWLTLGMEILIWEYFAPSGQLLSDAADHWIDKRPVAARLAIITLGGMLTAHLANIIPQPSKYDVVSQDFWRRFSRGNRRKQT